MTRCSVCSCILVDSMVCPECEYDSSLDYEINPTMAPVKSRTRSASGIIKDRKREINQRIKDELSAEKNMTALETQISQLLEIVEALREMIRVRDDEIKALKQSLQTISKPIPTQSKEILTSNIWTQNQNSSNGRMLYQGFCDSCANSCKMKNVQICGRHRRR